MALHKRWLQANPTASWRDVINALKQCCKENEILNSIEHQLKCSTETDSNMEITISTSTELTGSSSNDNIETMTAGPVTGKLINLIQHSLTDPLLQVVERIY